MPLRESADLRFLVLGRLAITGADAAPQALPAGHLDELVSWLVMNANRPISSEQLADTLWPDPSNGVADRERELRGLLARLRTRLHDLGAGTVDIGPDTVTLQTPPDSIDANRFAAAIDGGIDRHGYPTGAVDLGDALALWRGDPYPSLADRIDALGVIEHLRELRLDAIEAVHAAALRHQVGHVLVADLRFLVHEHPHRDRLRRLLALALFRTSRRAEAIRVLDQHRRELAQRGQPTPLTLLRLERAIMSDDPATHHGQY